ncbi:hypothetical protein FACS1894132_09510 [Clostridia bacterium]|nr:hypothetical protein FACS1894132_09510 [Clostridia bacterium]
MIKYQTGDLFLNISQKQKYDYNSGGVINAVYFSIAKFFDCKEECFKFGLGVG